MKWLEKFLYRMTGYLPCRIITGDGKERPYLERYKLFRKMSNNVAKTIFRQFAL